MTTKKDDKKGDDLSTMSTDEKGKSAPHVYPSHGAATEAAVNDTPTSHELSQGSASTSVSPKAKDVPEGDPLNPPAQQNPDTRGSENLL